MTLGDYLSTQNLRPSEFAARIGVSASTVTRLLKGERRPGLDLLAKIKAGTDGAVTADDWLAESPAAEGAAA